MEKPWIRWAPRPTLPVEGFWLALVLFGGAVHAQSTCAATDAAVTAVNPGDPAALAGDCAALLGAKDALRGTGTLNWANTVGMSSWDGVTVSASRVTKLRLHARSLDGNIPDLSGLAGLEELLLYGNRLSGSIPAELGSLANLQRLDVNGNRLSGSIPAELGSLANLRMLILSANRLSGNIPAELGSLANLQRLSAYENELTGTIPTTLGSLANLDQINLGDNELTGSIPSELGSLASLQQLHLYGNELSGNIPAELGALANLVLLSLHENGLTGSIPAELGSLASLGQLTLHGNELTGNIPAELGSLTSLQQLDLYDNELTGTIPTELGSLASLRQLALHENELTGSIPDLSRLTGLRGLYLHGNELTGNIPDLSRLTGLQWLFLHRNRLTGNIPDLSALANLQWLWLHQNRLSGGIPATLGGLTGLAQLHLAVNDLTGGIPASLGNLAGLRSLSLCDNDLDSAAVLPAALESRRTANPPGLTVWSCARIEDATAAEGSPLAFDLEHSTFPVRGAPGAAGLTLSYETSDGGATSPSDYTSTSGTVTIPGNTDPATSTSAATIDVPTASDLVAESDETLTMRLAASGGEMVFVVPAVATGTITDVPPPAPPPPPEPPEPPTVAFGAAAASVVEATGAHDARVNLSSVANADMTVHYALSGTATEGTDYAMPAAGTVTIPFGSRSAAIPIAIMDDGDVEGDETVVLTLTSGPAYTVGDPEAHVLTIIDDDGPECKSRVAPYWRGTGGFAVRPADGRSATVRLQCGGARFSSREYAGEDGLIVRAVDRSMCLGPDGRPLHGELTFEGIDDDGWYWINGDWNVALSPLVCESSLKTSMRPPVPDGVTASPSGDRLFLLAATGRHYGTLMSHDLNGFIGLVPHLADMEGNGEHVAPYWMGHGGVVGRPMDGNAATFRLSCEDGREKSWVLEAGEDGIVVSLLSGCFDGDGDPIGGELRADGLEDGAWYWINSGRLAAGEHVPVRRRCRPGACSTAAPFVRRDSDPAAPTVPVVPGGVDADRGPLGTLFSHGSLIGIVPRIETTDE